MDTSVISPLCVASVLRQSRKGKLSYDRHWNDRTSSVERVVKEVLSDFEGLSLSSDSGKDVFNVDESGEKHTDHIEVKQRSKKSTENEPNLLIKSEVQTGLVSPHNYGDRIDMYPVTKIIQRNEERDISNHRCIMMAKERQDSCESSPNVTTDKCNYSDHNSSHPVNLSLNKSLNFSQTHNTSLNSSSLFYDTPEIVKYKKIPRVDVLKLKLPLEMFVKKEEIQNSTMSFDTHESDAEYCRLEDEKLKGVSKPKHFHNIEDANSSNIEDELIRYELQCLDEAERRVEERKALWDAVSKERDREAREKLKIEKSKIVNTFKEQIELGEVEKRVEERVFKQKQEREQKQKDLIEIAKKEEQIAKAQLEKKARIEDQTERLSPIHTNISNSIQTLFQLWNGQENKELFNADVKKCAVQILQDSKILLNEAMNKAVEGNCGDDVFAKLTTFSQNVITSISDVRNELIKIEKEKLIKEAEEKKAAEEKLRLEKEMRSKEIEQEKNETQIVNQESNSLKDQDQSSTPISSGHISGVLNSISAENKTWYDSIVQFKTDFVKDVIFSEGEKPYKFSLQKAVNTPLNSLSGVSSAHLQDKIDKLVQLFSGQQVTVNEQSISTNDHRHARTFCLGLAAKKLAKQGEDVVSVDSKSAFPAATLALALWDKYPEFGMLLLAYLFELCPFLVPYHPQQEQNQSDKSYYLTLGYKYEGESIEKQDKYLKRMSGVARLYAALSVSHIPKSSSSSTHPHPLSKIWALLTSICNLTPHTDITASLLLDVLEVSGNAMFSSYGKMFGKLLVLLKDKHLPHLENVKSESGPTVRLEQFLTTAIRGQSIKEPEGLLRQGFV